MVFVRSMEARLLENWTLNYGDGRKPKVVQVPHAWQQQMPVDDEGPVIYECRLDVPEEPCKLRFRGVSYQAVVIINGKPVCVHEGIWDAFEVSLIDYLGEITEIAIKVTKNGGETFPVRDVASGFLPYVFNTFGGIFGEVELVEYNAPIELPAAEPRVTVDGSKIFVDGEPIYLRGLLHWGWYPELGHTNVTESVIRDEIRGAKALGFNLVKFCLWVPPHRYLELLEEEGMLGWLELPLWDPTPDDTLLAKMGQEIERIVRQYRHHRSIAVWTVGCELSTATPPEYRAYLQQLVSNLTGCPLVKDNSGGAEMYGGDLREFGTFDDFHPYCELPFYPQVLDSLMTGPRKPLPILLGEFNDVDTHRDLPGLAHEMPYWSSSIQELNAKGVRWQHDLPQVLSTSPLANDRLRSQSLMASSLEKAAYIRKTVQEAVHSRSEIGGFVLTGWRDTPISSSGVFDDYGSAKWQASDFASWNADDCLFLIPTRRPPWVAGGNRPGWQDLFNYFVGQVFIRVGLHTTRGKTAGLTWRILDQNGSIVARGAAPSQSVGVLDSKQVAEIVWQCNEPGAYKLAVEFGTVVNEWPIWVVSKIQPEVRVVDSSGVFLGLTSTESGPIITSDPSVDGDIVVLAGGATVAKPFWREAAYEFVDDAFWAEVPFAEQWSRLAAISPDRVIDPQFLASLQGAEVLIRRIDTRTYKEHAVLVRQGRKFITTLRPYGGLGNQPVGVKNNPAGQEFLRSLIKLLAN